MKVDKTTQAAITKGAAQLLNPSRPSEARTVCRDCGTGLALDVAQEYQLCSVCDSIEKTDAVMGEGR